MPTGLARSPCGMFQNFRRPSPGCLWPAGCTGPGLHLHALFSFLPSSSHSAGPPSPLRTPGGACLGQMHLPPYPANLFPPGLTPSSSSSRGTKPRGWVQRTDALQGEGSPHWASPSSNQLRKSCLTHVWGSISLRTSDWNSGTSPPKNNSGEQERRFLPPPFLPSAGLIRTFPVLLGFKHL